MMTREVRNGVVTVDGKAYAAGLQWLPASMKKSRGDLLREARQELDRNSHVDAGTADLVALRYRDVSHPQYGLGWTAFGLKAGLQPLAAIFATSVADVLGANWIVAFQVTNQEGQDLWWVASCSQDIIETDGDLLFDGEEEAAARFRELISLSQGQQPQIVCPGTWGIPRSSDEPLDGFLTHKATGVTLMPINGMGALLSSLPLFSALSRRAGRSDGGRRGLAIALVGVTAVAAVGGALWWKESQEEAERQAMIARLAAQRAAQQQQVPQTTASPAAPQVVALTPWQDTPPAPAVLRTCDAILREIGSPIGGWALERMSCEVTGKTVKATLGWRHTYGLFQDFQGRMSRLGVQQVSFDGDHQLAAATIARAIEWQRQEEEPTTEDAILAAFFDRLAPQVSLHELKGQLVEHRVPVTDAEGQTVAIHVTPGSLDYRIGTRTLVPAILDRLAAIPTLTVTEAIWSKGWVVTGKIYGQKESR